MSNQTAPRPVAREYLEALLIAFVFAIFTRTYVFQAFTIPSGSMEENLLIGDHILVNKFIYGPALCRLERLLLPLRAVRRGDVVVFRWPVDPSRDYIKRAMGLPGDVVQLSNKRLYINGSPAADETYTHHEDPVTYPGGSATSGGQPRDNFGPVRVPPRRYFCLGDNRDNSRDSRFWGMVPAGHLRGRALIVYWSFAGEPSDVGEWPGSTGLMQRIARLGPDFFSHTRWERTGRIVR
jgi:signal peptidase I